MLLNTVTAVTFFEISKIKLVLKIYNVFFTIEVSLDLLKSMNRQLKFRITSLIHIF